MRLRTLKMDVKCIYSVRSPCSCRNKMVFVGLLQLLDNLLRPPPSLEDRLVADIAETLATARKRREEGNKFD